MNTHTGRWFNVNTELLPEIDGIKYRKEVNDVILDSNKEINILYIGSKQTKFYGEDGYPPISEIKKLLRIHAIFDKSDQEGIKLIDEIAYWVQSQSFMSPTTSTQKAAQEFINQC